MKGKIISIDGNKVTIRPNENFMNIQVDKNSSYLKCEIGREVEISFGTVTGKVEILIDGGFYEGILVD